MRWLIATFLGTALFLGHADVLGVDKEKNPYKTQAPLEIMGLEFSQPFSMVECKFKQIGGTSYKTYLSVSENKIFPCFKHSPLKQPGDVLKPSEEMIKVIFSAAPAGMDNEIYIDLVNNSMEVMRIPTFGYKSQASALEKLIEKYGQPSKKTVNTVQNRMGAYFDKISAEWKFPNLSVNFEGMGSSIDKGLIFIATPAGFPRLDKLHHEEKSKEPKL